MKTKLLILTGVLLMIALAITVSMEFFGWPLIIVRNQEYRDLIHNFQRAQRKERVKEADDSVHWQVQAQVPESRTSVQIKGTDVYGVARIRFQGEQEEHQLYEYVDYSYVGEVRVAQNTLFVYWYETLFHTDHWLMAYDLVARREIVRRKIDPEDLTHLP
jgi:hypothetical protein